VKNSAKCVLRVGVENKNVFGDSSIKVAHCKKIMK
jgi:hypothetical protein